MNNMTLMRLLFFANFWSFSYITQDAKGGGLVKHYGNICEIDGSKIEPVSCITGGSPC